LATVDLILFDCDGVLVDSEIISAECAASELANLGMSLSTEDILKRFLGRSRSEIADSARRAGFVVPKDFVERIETHIQRRFEKQLKPIEGVSDILHALLPQICVASGSPLGYIRRALDLTGLLVHFEDHLFSATMVRDPKPAPDVFLYAAASMGATATYCLVIEDSLSGIAGAKAAAMAVIGFIGGSHLNADLIRGDYYAAGCDEVFDSMQALGAHLADLGAMTGH
jgi:HAD superfamily hydrolase (TIGR01509 family)